MFCTVCVQLQSGNVLDLLCFFFCHRGAGGVDWLRLNVVPWDALGPAGGGHHFQDLTT